MDSTLAARKQQSSKSQLRQALDKIALWPTPANSRDDDRPMDGSVKFGAAPDDSLSGLVRVDQRFDLLPWFIQCACQTERTGLSQRRGPCI
jgi:hypothetical protein